MTCREFESFLIAGGMNSVLSEDERSPQRRHVEACARCHAIVDDLLGLGFAFERLRQTYDGSSAPDVQVKLLQEFRRHHSRRAPQFMVSQPGAWRALAIAAAAVIVVVAIWFAISAGKNAVRPAGITVVKPKVAPNGRQHLSLPAATARKKAPKGTTSDYSERPKKYAVEQKPLMDDKSSAQAQTATALGESEIRTGFITIQPGMETGDAERSILRMKLPTSSVLPLGIPVNPVQEDSRHRVTADVVVDQFGNAQAIRLVSPNPARPK